MQLIDVVTVENIAIYQGKRIISKGVSGHELIHIHADCCD